MGKNIPIEIGKLSPEKTPKTISVLGAFPNFYDQDPFNIPSYKINDINKPLVSDIGISWTLEAIRTGFKNILDIEKNQVDCN